jgi:hypothetical protein
MISGDRKGALGAFFIDDFERSSPVLAAVTFMAGANLKADRS